MKKEDFERLNQHFKEVTRKELKELLNILELNEIALDKVDWESIDNTNDYTTLKEELEESYGITIQTPEEMEQHNKEIMQREQRHHVQETDDRIFQGWDQLIPTLKTVFVTGNIRQGKTSFCYHMLQKIKKFKKVYVFKHPNPRLISKIGFNNLSNIDELENLNDCCIYIDEPNIVWPRYSKRGSIILQKLLSLVGQKDIILILSTSDTRYLTSAEEFYVNCFVIKRIDYDLIKRGSKIKTIIDSMAYITPSGFARNLELNEYLLYSSEKEELNSKYTFKESACFNEKLSKPFKRKTFKEGKKSFPKSSS